MNIILQKLWQYWKWVCIALMTTTVVLFLLATIITHFKTTPMNEGAGECIDSGGTWNTEAQECRRAG